MNEQLMMQFDEIKEKLPRTIEHIKTEDDIEALRETTKELTKILILTLETLHKIAERKY
jgi:predicted small metal-binding protein